MTTWPINPLIRPLARLVDDAGTCALPDDVLHCHGAEIEHADGIAECYSFSGVCEAPGPGRHAFRHQCERASGLGYEHRCNRCR